jgi:hypothetical protein
LLLPEAEALNVEATINPQPSTLTLLGIGSLGLLGYGWRRRLGHASP